MLDFTVNGHIECMPVCVQEYISVCRSLTVLILHIYRSLAVLILHIGRLLYLFYIYRSFTVLILYIR